MTYGADQTVQGKQKISRGKFPRLIFPLIPSLFERHISIGCADLIWDITLDENSALCLFIGRGPFFYLTVIEHTRTARIRATHWHTVCDGRTKHGCSKVSICRRAFKQKKWNANGLPITVTTLCPLVGGTVYGALKTVHTKSGRSFLYKENPPDSK